MQSSEIDAWRAWVDIDLGALLRNGEALARHARVPLLPMVKADAYGLGVVPVSRALGKLDPFGFGVATVAEGRELRMAGIVRPIYIFTPLLAEEFPAARAIRLTPALAEGRAIADWTEAGGGAWHLAIDTGMNRAGIRWDIVGTLADQLRQHPPEGVFTHFHSAEMDDGSMAVQEARFREALGVLETLGVRPQVLHAENSAAIVRHTPSPWSVVRPGAFLYGIGSGAALQPEPVVHLRAHVLELHDVYPGETASYEARWKATRRSRIATVAAGYADGYRRSLGNAGEVLIGGRRASVVGTVTMDMTMIDVTDVPCAVGDVVTLMGVDGDQVITAEAVAAACDLSPYEILTGLRQRLPRRYG